MLALRPGRRAALRGVGAAGGRRIASWTGLDPAAISGSRPAQAYNLVNGQWQLTAKTKTIPDPLNGEPFIRLPDTQTSEIAPFVESLRAVPKSGLHNPYKNPERYTMYGAVCAHAAEEMRKPEVEDYFTRLVQRVAPKSYPQAQAEVVVTRRFLENFCGDQVRFTARGFTTSGDHAGQTSTGMRWPFGAVGLITPFNFPLEIPALQALGALFMGNKPLIHVDHRVSIVAEAFLRMLHACGMPPEDADMVHGAGTVVGELLQRAKPRSTLFTGSQRVAELVSASLGGRVFLEDAGFDWKVLGPDVAEEEYVAWTCDQDAYACSGQKCSAQSILFMHTNWVAAGLEERLAKRAGARKLDDLTVGPVLTWTTQAMLDHINRLLEIPGARVAFGGNPLEGHTIPDVYGALQPTAVFVPLEQMLRAENYPIVTREVFGPFQGSKTRIELLLDLMNTANQVLTEYSDTQLPLVLEALERLDAHLTAAVVSNDQLFLQQVLGATVNGTTYAGLRARTTGAPQNHWFGPAGDPRAAGIGTPEAIRLVWSCHREIITDYGPVPAGSASLKST